MAAPRLPNHGDTVDLVLDGFGTFGQADRETGQPEPPLRVVACKTAEGWSRDIAANIAQEVLAGADKELFPALRDVVERAG
jgi:hypothetical protein